MASGLRVILFNVDEGYSAELRQSMLRVDGIKIVAEVDEPVLLPQAAKQFPCDVIVVHLDPLTGPALDMAGKIAAEFSDVAVFAVSQSTDGQLILAAMRTGIREFLTKPLDFDLLEQACSRVSQRRVESSSQGRLITVIGSAGGVGGTSIATNLAAELAKVAPGGVALADLDFRFGQVATMLDLDTTYTIGDLCESHEMLERQMVERALVQHECGVRVLGCPNDFSQAENISAAHCVGVLTSLLGMHEYVVVDGPSRFDPGARAVLDIADEILLVIHLLVPCVRNASRMVDGMRQVGFNLNRVKLICNRFGQVSASLSLDDVRQALNMDVFAVLPDDWASMSGSINLGEPLVSHAPKSKIRLAYNELAARLNQLEVADPVGSTGKKGGLLSKLF